MRGVSGRQIPADAQISRTWSAACTNHGAAERSHTLFAHVIQPSNSSGQQHLQCSHLEQVLVDAVCTGAPVDTFSHADIVAKLHPEEQTVLTEPLSV